MTWLLGHNFYQLSINQLHLCLWREAPQRDDTLIGFDTPAKRGRIGTHGSILSDELLAEHVQRGLGGAESDVGALAREDILGELGAVGA